MKKLLYLLLLLPLAFATSSCSKDDDVKPFELTLTLSGVTQVDGTFYAVAGDNITFDAFTAKPLGDKNTTVANVFFSINGHLLIPDPWNALDPWTFSTEGLAPGTYTLNVAGNLLQVDQSIMNFVANYKLVIVDSAENLPSGAPEIGAYSSTITYTNN